MQPLAILSAFYTRNYSQYIYSNESPFATALAHGVGYSGKRAFIVILVFDLFGVEIIFYSDFEF